jgi:hypothetical protein
VFIFIHLGGEEADPAAGSRAQSPACRPSASHHRVPRLPACLFRFAEGGGGGGDGPISRAQSPREVACK